MDIPPIIIDVEASGFGKNSYPIEIGIAFTNGKTACFLVKPEPDWQHWDLEGERLHGIKRELLFRHGKPVIEVAQSINQLLDGKIVYSDGWGFDQTWLSLLFDRAQLRQRFRLEALQSLFSQAQYDSWDKIKKRVITECKFRRHRASNDARALQLTFQRSLNIG